VDDVEPVLSAVSVLVLLEDELAVELDPLAADEVVPSTDCSDCKICCICAMICSREEPADDVLALVVLPDVLAADVDSELLLESDDDGGGGGGGGGP